ncbi:MAG: hypothetical protein R2702_12335 [Acidimicrobiales bacterium]
MWIEVTPTRRASSPGSRSEHIERCDVNAVPEPPYAALTLRSGMICYISDPWSMKKLQRVMGVDLPRAAD